MAHKDAPKGVHPGAPRRQVTLPSSAIASIRKGRGRDLMNAQRALVGTPAASDPVATQYALIAELAEIDGRQIVYEQVLEMDLADVLALTKEVFSDDFQSPQPALSPASSVSDSEPRN